METDNLFCRFCKRYFESETEIHSRLCCVCGAPAIIKYPMTPAMLRYLRCINAQHQRRLFAGNHNVRHMLEEAGYIEVISREGLWRRLRPTEKGIAALNAQEVQG